MVKERERNRAYDPIYSLSTFRTLSNGHHKQFQEDVFDPTEAALSRLPPPNVWRAAHNIAPVHSIAEAVTATLRLLQGFCYSKGRH